MWRRGMDPATEFAPGRRMVGMPSRMAQTDTKPVMANAALRPNPLSADRGERLGEVGHQVVGVLDADRQADRRVADADALARRLRHAGMHRRRRVADQRFGAAEADREREDLERVEKVEGLLAAALNVERENRAG